MDELKSDSILVAEFEYIAQAAFQVSEDRAKVSNFYLITVGSFVAAMLGANLEGADSQTVDAIFAVLFTVLALNGLVTLLKLVQLRLAWLDSVTAMNKIKRFYFEHNDQDANSEFALASAFRWTKLPTKFRFWSISFLLAVEVALLGGAAAGMAIFFVDKISAQPDLPEPGIVGILWFALQLFVYWFLLRDKSDSEAN